ncbi:uncharacterized protein BX664DRAFT_327382 [Halteromyces radiatus]|uniref:uncharacterized protein n=1 Tax=Halteromyces radiatus TaxID=101107 RepID=UPI0022208AE5|nr:uncharacterized protein BX664DRAFT_327382 [Halteromyces radiatus]KAI8092482.1 hypothetical protein BX664DRAFT_327382 [Halteromyces radiatus]
MRASRGLQVTSLVVLSPVALILFSLLAILTSTLFSQLQSWCLPIVSLQSTRTLSRWATTAMTLSYNNYTITDDTFLSPPDDTTSTINDMNNNMINFRPPSLIQIWLKRWRYSKRKSPSLWTCCGISIIIGLVFINKMHVQKCQLYEAFVKFITHAALKARHGLILCNNKVNYWMEYLFTDSSQQQQLKSTSDMIWINNDDIDKQDGKTKYSHVRPKTSSSGSTTIGHRHSMKKSKKQHHQRTSAIKNQFILTTTTTTIDHNSNIPGTCTVDTPTSNIVDPSYANTDDWVSVGEKKRKDTMETFFSQQQQQQQQQRLNQQEQHYHHQQQELLHNTDNSDKVSSDNLEEQDNNCGDDDDSDKTIVEEDHIQLTGTTPTTSDDETDLGSPCFSSSDGVYHQHQHLEPTIRNWYSPFSTGLDIDILPRHDPLTQLDPMQLNKSNMMPYYPVYNKPAAHRTLPFRSTHRLQHHHIDNFSLLQNHPFISHPHRIHAHQSLSHIPSTSSLGVIGQHVPSSPPSITKPVQNSKSRRFSLFI